MTADRMLRRAKWLRERRSATISRTSVTGGVRVPRRASAATNLLVVQTEIRFPAPDASPSPAS